MDEIRISDAERRLTDPYKDTNNNNILMRAASGRVNDNDHFVNFIYLLCRDHLPIGVVEEIVRKALEKSNVLYTNGWLAQYSQYTKERLAGKHEGG